MDGSKRPVAAPPLERAQDLGNPLTSVSVPKGRDRALLGLALENLAEFRAQLLSVLTDQNVSSQGHGYRALRIVAQGQARYFQIGGFFLDATGVSDNHCGAAL